MPRTIQSEIVNFLLQNHTILAGTTIRWINRDIVPHTVTAGTPTGQRGEWNSGLFALGEAFEFTFVQPGTFPYFCLPHPFMQATITVTG